MRRSETWRQASRRGWVHGCDKMSRRHHVAGRLCAAGLGSRVPSPSRSLAALVLLALGGLGCLSSFAPNLRARGVHEALHPQTTGEVCMGCHVSERDALAQPDTPTAAPIVADWMLADERSCTGCHRVREPSPGRHAQRGAGPRVP
ncbi:hypothetical protein G6O69_21420 [Pseudenhygromyxa sp. WMMC2535]|uniref:hypothetical protein n=1 Tax=Pseudenhygromyxa sp. WMMC2535 TaxID=2712867 RepID=UPI001594EA45|nr:hypothetical protein [Pseudenhygromyxa sp. WMMC2535]NVB40414.1 hypothetical protein [Pseudenhygromyxa sp. WMMC2535]